MKLRNKLLSLALVATVAATSVVPVFAGKHAPTEHDRSGAFLVGPLLFPIIFLGSLLAISKITPSVVKKARGVQKLAVRDDEGCFLFSLFLAQVIAGVAVLKYVNCMNNGGYSSK